MRKRHVYVDNGWLWIWNQCFYLGIWNDDRTKMIVLSSFHFATRFNSQNANETETLMNPDTLICLWIFVFPIGIIEVSTSRKCWFWLEYSSLHNYWTPSTWNSLVHTSWGEVNDVKNVIFSFSKCENKISRNKNQVRNRLFIDSYVF